MADGTGPRVSIAVALLSLGEGWHDYHHLFPWDYAAAAPERLNWQFWNQLVFFSAINVADNIVIYEVYITLLLSINRFPENHRRTKENLKISFNKIMIDRQSAE